MVSVECGFEFTFFQMVKGQRTPPQLDSLQGESPLANTNSLCINDLTIHIAPLLFTPQDAKFCELYIGDSTEQHFAYHSDCAG
jgi:hypothetical protein